MKRIFISLCLLISAFCCFAQAKYVFYFIGDGMGPNQVNATEMYLAELEGKIGRKQLLMTQLPYGGSVSTFSESNGITCSAAAGTALASGEKTNNGTVGLHSDGTPVVTVAERLKQKGWGVGITTSVSIDHATPASFYAKSKSRNDYYKIGTQLAESGFDFFGGATFYQPYPKNKKTRQQDKSVKSLYKLCEENGYTFAHGYGEYQNKKDSADKMILIQAHEGLTDDYEGDGLIPYRIDRKLDDLTLPQITEAAIDFLSAHHDRFFLMVEGGAIDWASHSNDAATAIKDVIDMDEAIRVAYEFYLQHQDETLIVITADHETGGMSMGNRVGGYTLNLQILQNQHISLAELSNKLKDMHKQYGKKMTWEMVRNMLKEDLGFYDKVEITPEEDADLKKQFKSMKKGKSKDVKTLYKQLSSLTFNAVQLLNQKAHLAWGTTGHSAATVPVFAVGVGAEQFVGWQDNTTIVPKIMHATGE